MLSSPAPVVAQEKVIEKFGADYLVDEETYVMGVHHKLAQQIATRFAGHSKVLDACTGAGFMAIAIARVVERVIAVDCDDTHLRQARHNAALAGFAEKIEFVHADVIDCLRHAQINFDAAFLDPDLAGLNEQKQDHVTRLDDMQPSARELFNETSKTTATICLRLPREIDQTELGSLPPHELKLLTLEEDPKFYCAYFEKLSR